MKKIIPSKFNIYRKQNKEEENYNMETLYKCKYTGKIFTNRLNCEESEYVNGEETKQFTNLVNLFISVIENKYNIVVVKELLDIYDKKQNYIDDRMVHWRHVGFEFALDNIQKEYYRTSDEVGDGRWDWNINTLDEMVLDFEREFIIPTQKVFEGTIREESDDDYYSNRYWLIDNKRIDMLFSIFEGKRIRIEILE